MSLKTPIRQTSHFTDGANSRRKRLFPELKTMAKTIRDRLEGITSYWTFGHAGNASTEGFNNKIRWLTRQAYGFRDLEYFNLKIYQLPEINCEKSL